MTQPGTVGPTLLSGQATNLLHAFNTETFQDIASGAWNMDTCASFHLNSSITSDFATRRVLLRCDSMRDLYLVTSPSPILHAFLVSQHTWHQRLGHPGSEVLCRLVFSNFILYNKEKPPVLCHACQLGKHMRLPFSMQTVAVEWLVERQGMHPRFLLSMATHLEEITSHLTQEIVSERDILLFGS
nr:ribonuclease H-like domain-containing protein [Tanacetum cinerariifolium]